RFVDYAQNEYFFTLTDLTAPSLPIPDGETQVCVDWTAYFVDTNVPGEPFAEGFPGLALVGAHPRLRAHDAAFARFVVRARGPYASYGSGGYLDADGCMTVPSVALTYQEGAPRGSAEGIVLQIVIDGRLSQPTPLGPVF